MSRPAFDDVAVSEETSSWGRRTVRATFCDDARLGGYSATIVNDTRNPRTGDRLTTMVVRFPRCILPEINTHRVFSRNSASSRARSVRTTISGVMKDPYIPIFTRNGKGMSGEFLDGDELGHAKRIWLSARDAAVSSELALLLGDMYDGDPTTVGDDWEHYLDLYYGEVYHADHAMDGVPSVHKQNANRIIEPYMWHEALITSSYWDNFFTLRLDDAAQPEMHATASVMKAVMDVSRPEESPIHCPFIDVKDADDAESVRKAFISSASECARISYKDRTAIGLSEGSDLGRRMLEAGHMSPFEHQALDLREFSRLGMDAESDRRHLNGNLSPSWVQFRHILSR